MTIGLPTTMPLGRRIQTDTTRLHSKIVGCVERVNSELLRTLGHAKLLEFTQFINSLYPTIKFTLVHSPTSLDVLDLTLSLVDGYI